MDGAAGAAIRAVAGPTLAAMTVSKAARAAIKPDQAQFEFLCLGVAVPEFRGYPKRMPHSAHPHERNAHTKLGHLRMPGPLLKSNYSPAEPGDLPTYY